MKIVRYILGGICALTAILFLILAIRLSIIIGDIPTEATGTVLTHEFIMTDCARHSLSYQRAMLFATAPFLALTSLGAIFIKKFDDKILPSIYNWLFVISIMTTCISAALAPAPDAVSVLTYEPVVYEGHVSDMYSEGSSYYLVFNGKSSINVSSSEYYNVKPGANYYLDYFGNELSGAYDPSTYTLP